MAKPRLLVTQHWPGAVEIAPSDVCEVVLSETDQPLSRAQLAQAMGEFDVLCVTIRDRIDEEILSAGSRVKLIATYGVGYDHIDIEAARTRGVAVTNTPGVVTESTADLAMTLLLMAARRTGEAERVVRAGKWGGWCPSQFVGSSLNGKMLGLVGFGGIGQAMARRAHHGFGMKIAYHARHEVEREVAEECDAVFFPNLMEMLGEANFISLHVPGGEQTAGMISASAFNTMKRGSYLINTARGGVVDHGALAEALSSGQLAGAGLDVYPEEPTIPEQLLNLENVVLLPHVGSADAESRRAIAERVFANVRAWAADTPLPDRVA